MSNKGVFFAVVGVLAFSIILATTPMLMDIFDVVQVSGWHWAIMVGLASFQLFSVELLKLFIRKRDAKKAKLEAI